MSGATSDPAETNRESGVEGPPEPPVSRPGSPSVGPRARAEEASPLTRRSSAADLLSRVWERLQQVRHLDTHAWGDKPVNVGGVGRGDVVLERPSEETLTFNESGLWTPDVGRTLSHSAILGRARSKAEVGASATKVANRRAHPFRNVYQWTLDRADGALSLSHLRYGANQPVLLLRLQWATDATLSAAEPHHCSPDIYDGHLTIGDDSLVLHWTITGPNKDYRIRTNYHAFRRYSSGT